MAKLKGGTRIYGDIKIDGGIYDSSNQIGVGGSILITTGTGIAWTSNILPYAQTAGVSTNVIGGIGSLTQLNVSGICTISVNSSSDALRITQIGSGNALLVEDSANPDTTPFVVRSDGFVGIGTTNPTQSLDVNGNIRIRGSLYDSNNQVGTANSVLISTGTNINWSNVLPLGISSSSTFVGAGISLINFRGTGISTITVSSGIATINTVGPDISPVIMGMIF